MLPEHIARGPGIMKRWGVGLGKAFLKQKHWWGIWKNKWESVKERQEDYFSQHLLLSEVHGIVALHHLGVVKNTEFQAPWIRVYYFPNAPRWVLSPSNMRSTGLSNSPKGAAYKFLHEIPKAAFLLVLRRTNHPNIPISYNRIFPKNIIFA